VRSSLASYTLGANVEVLVVTAAGAANGTGNTLNNVIYAGAGNNVLDGAAGTDTASYVFATTGVTVSLGLAGAQNTIGSGSDTLLNFENLNGSTLADNLSGNAGANALFGDLGNDRLNGAGGNDTLTGGAGNDIFAFSAPGFGADRVVDFDAVNDANGFDLLDISGLGITAASFSANVTITDIAGPDLLVTIGADSIRLTNVAAADFSVNDFLLAP
jgi:Ca2+-binding RTX toxin-like protein